MKQTVAHPCGNQYALCQKLSALTLLNTSACVFVIKRKRRPRVTSIRETLCCMGCPPRSGRAEATAMGAAMLPHAAVLSWRNGACIACLEPRGAGGPNRLDGRAATIDCLQARRDPVCSLVLGAQLSCCMGRNQRVLFEADGRSNFFNGSTFQSVRARDFVSRMPPDRQCYAHADKISLQKSLSAGQSHNLSGASGLPGETSRTPVEPHPPLSLPP